MCFGRDFTPRTITFPALIEVLDLFGGFPIRMFRVTLMRRQLLWVGNIMRSVMFCGQFVYHQRRIRQITASIRLASGEISPFSILHA